MSLTSREVAGILRHSGLPGAVDLDLLMRISTTEERQSVIHSAAASAIEKMTAAVIEIQRWWRGYSTRCILAAPSEKVICQPSASGEATGAGSPILTSDTSTASDEGSSTPSTINEPQSPCPSTTLIEASYTAYLSDAHVTSASASSLDLLSFEGFCAAVIQKWWRAISQLPSEGEGDEPEGTTAETSTISAPGTTESPFKMSSEESIADRKSHILSVNFSKNNQIAPCQDASAAIIQRAWRRHVDTNIFQYYKDLIISKLRGRAPDILKSINPQESELLDHASGTFLKFRLVGETFPPVLCYKIFTHCNVADIGAFAPRDYTHFSAKQPPPQIQHNHAASHHADKDVTWYSRQENNGWRLITRMGVMAADGINDKPDHKKIIHHNYSKIRRMQDVKQRRKSKKINWLRTMYREGMLQAKADTNATAVIKSAANGIVQLADDKGANHIDESEVDELLFWTRGLDLDKYTIDWMQLGTLHCGPLPLDSRHKIQITQLIADTDQC